MEEKHLESKLRHLYALQRVDTSLDELEEMKGDLPREVMSTEEKLQALQEQYAELEKTMKAAFAMRDNADSEIITLREKVEKYKAQQYAVRNNREYDALTKEMDGAADAIGKLERDMEMLEGKATLARTDMEATKVRIDESKKTLEEKRAALAEITRTTEEEEAKLRNERQKIVARLAKSDVATYERIRKARKGTAIVPVKRGACGGCYNRVPPQKLLELRQNSKLYMCERCGRILVSDEIVKSFASVA